MAKMIVVTPDRCVGCKCCELECSLVHTDAGGLAEALQSGVHSPSRVQVEHVDELPVPVQCRHCPDARCAAVCPKDSLTFGDDGQVLLDVETCIGCGMCTLVCPFGVISVQKEIKKAVKCDLCGARAEGPACVAACPTQTLSLGEPDPATAELLDPATVAQQLDGQAQAPAEGDKVAACSLCGAQWAKPKALAVVSKKLDGRAPAANVCPKCRRIRTARALVGDACPTQAGCKEE